MIAALSWPSVQKNYGWNSRSGPSGDAIPQPYVVDDDLVRTVTQAMSVGGTVRLSEESGRQQEKHRCDDRLHRALLAHHGRCCVTDRAQAAGAMTAGARS